MPTLTDDKKSLGEIAKLPAEEGAVILEPFVKANQERFKGVVEAVQASSKLAESIRSVVNFPLLDFVKNIQLPDTSALTNMMRDPYEGMNLSGLAMRDNSVVVRKTAWEIKKEQREAYRTELEIKKLEADLNLVRAMQTPEYDAATGIITFIGKHIQIPLDSNLEDVCRVVLKNVKTMKTRWSWDEVFEDDNLESNKANKMKMYTAVRAINEKVVLQTQINDFLLGKPIGTVRLNPIFLAN